MDKKFQQRIDKLPAQLATLKSCKSIKRDNLAGIPTRGVYLFIEHSKPIYVGRTNRMRKRLLEHSRTGSGHNGASFAFKLAKEQAVKLGINTKRKRKDLVEDKKFNKVFQDARLRVATMDIKYIEIENAIDQYLFEVYASEVLKTPFNDFENH